MFIIGSYPCLLLGLTLVYYWVLPLFIIGSYPCLLLGLTLVYYWVLPLFIIGSYSCLLLGLTLVYYWVLLLFIIGSYPCLLLGLTLVYYWVLPLFIIGSYPCLLLGLTLVYYWVLPLFIIGSYPCLLLGLTLVYYWVFLFQRESNKESHEQRRWSFRKGRLGKRTALSNSHEVSGSFCTVLLTHLCFEISLPFVVIEIEIKHKYEKYLKGSCKLFSDLHYSCYFLKIVFVTETSK